jgi:hypothetical protein
MEGAPGRIRETSSINTSLTVLGLVILRLTERQAHIPYRNSKLTFLLQVGVGRSWLVPRWAGMMQLCCTHSLGGNRGHLAVWSAFCSALFPSI